MISRIYTVHDVDNGIETMECYKGFDKRFTPSEMETVAILVVEGDPELFVLDDTKDARAEFLRFVADMPFDDVVIAGIYKRTK